jgi:hypothetical protein
LYSKTNDLPNTLQHGTQHAQKQKQKPVAHRLHTSPQLRPSSARLQQANPRSRRRSRLRQLILPPPSKRKQAAQTAANRTQPNSRTSKHNAANTNGRRSYGDRRCASWIFNIVSQEVKKESEAAAAGFWTFERYGQLGSSDWTEYVQDAAGFEEGRGVFERG